VVTERLEVGAEQVELDDDGVVAVVQGDELVALIGERRARPPEVSRTSSRRRTPGRCR
jgi:hypothetical protein